MKTIGRLVVRAIIFASCFSMGAYTVFAHPLTQRYSLYDKQEVAFDQYGQTRTHYYVGSETNGWRVDENYHSADSGPIYYKLSSEIESNNTIKASINAGAAKWRPCGKLEYNNSSYTSNMVTAIDLSRYNDNQIIACLNLGDSSVNSDGHFTRWTIEVNKGRSEWVNTTAASFAHEFGHVFGLADLYNSNNTNKIMYYTESGCTVSGPNGSDRNGVLVATGQHTTHEETGMYEQTSPNTASHCAKCGDCLAKFYPVSSCRWDNRCVRTNVGYHYRYCYDCQGRSIQYCNYVGNTCVMCGGR